MSSLSPHSTIVLLLRRSRRYVLEHKIYAHLVLLMLFSWCPPSHLQEEFTTGPP